MKQLKIKGLEIQELGTKELKVEELEMKKLTLKKQKRKVIKLGQKLGKLKKSALALAVTVSMMMSACVSIEFDIEEPVKTESVVKTEEAGKSGESDKIGDIGKSNNGNQTNQTNNNGTFQLEDVPDYTGEPYVEVNDNIPYFLESELTAESFETYSDLDELGRCGVAYASVGTDLMPTEGRGSIGKVKPSGWQTARYENVEGRYLYNRCHLIGFQLTAENANEKNLITGTRYLNVDGMLPFENQVAEYVKSTNQHVLYRVTPVFEGDNLVASGVLMEGKSVEDKGEGVLFCVYAYNVQPGIEIDYATGNSKLAEAEDMGGETYILNTGTKKFHYPSCSSAEQLKEENRKTFTGSRDELLKDGYEPCGKCKP